jgi:opacity protein-like surface antigen
LVGLRPISLLGAEIEYTDFGHPTVDTYSSTAPSFGVRADASAKAASAFGLVYLPLPLPLLDVYGKAGLARLRTTYNYNTGCVSCATAFLPAPGHEDSTDTAFAYGVGAQVKAFALAVRVEYERINKSSGNPDLLSAGITWSF